MIRRVLAPALAAALLFAGPARAQAPKALDPASIDEAKRHMKAGAAFYNDPAGHKCEEALREFTKAYALSGSLNALKGMAICNLELERDGDAIEQYGAYLKGKGGSLEGAEKAQIEADLNALKAAVATVKVSADKPGVRIVDVRTPARGFPIRNAYALPEEGVVGIGMHPGQHVITASVEGYPDQVWQVEIPNGGTLSHTFHFKKNAAPEPPPGPIAAERPFPVSAMVTAGISGAAAITWAALAVRAKVKNADYDKQNGHAGTAELTAMRSDVVKANVAADVLLGVTTAAVGTTVVLYLTRPSRPSSPAGPANRPQGFWVAPAVGISGGGAALGGSF